MRALAIADLPSATTSRVHASRRARGVVAALLVAASAGRGARSAGSERCTAGVRETRVAEWMAAHEAVDVVLLADATGSVLEELRGLGAVPGAAVFFARRRLRLGPDGRARAAAPRA
jgi:hypothetical protein